jgi:hypothetical protein
MVKKITFVSKPPTGKRKKISDFSVEKFWRRYLKLDNSLDREKYIKNIAKFVDGYKHIDKDELRLHMLSGILNSYFTELEQTIRGEKHGKLGIRTSRS